MSDILAEQGNEWGGFALTGPNTSIKSVSELAEDAFPVETSLFTVEREKRNI